MSEGGWLKRSFSRYLHREQVGGQFVRFVIVGLLNTVIDLAAFYLLALIPGMPLVVAKGLSYILGICNSFVWNKYWTFGAARSERGRQEFAVFFLVNLPPLLVNVIVFTVLGIWADSGDFKTRMLKAFAAAVVSVVWNFFGSRHLAFRHTAMKDKRHE